MATSERTFAARALAAVLLTATLQAAAQELPLRNSQFRDWNREQGGPALWLTSLNGYTAEQVCDAAAPAPCAVKLSATASRPSGQFGTFFHDLRVAAAGASALTLSGRIRTQAVKDGWAGFFMLVRAGGKTVAYKNSEADGARGDSEWRNFSIRVPVEPNAEMVRVGTLLTGTGSAWFSDLKLVVDGESKVALAARRDVPIPPRPAPSQTLLADSELALPATAVPTVRAAWRRDVLAHRHPIRSLFSDDFSDLAFLGPVLGDRRVIQLGESSHGVAEFNWMKVRLIKFLHEKLGYDVIAFESPMTQCDAAGETAAKESAEKTMRDCIFRVWHTDEVLALFDYVRQTQASPRPLRLTGFDNQSGSSFAATTGRFRTMLEILDPAAVPALLQHEGTLKNIKKENRDSALAYYTGLLQTLEQNRARLLGHLTDHPTWVDLAIQEARSRIALVRMHGLPMAEVSSVRDRAMADNLDFVLDTLYPKRKVIVWAHNAHIAYAPEKTGSWKPMGAWLAERRRSDLYTLGLYMGRGAGATNKREVYSILPPAAESFEAILANGGYKMSLLDFSRPHGNPDAAWLRTSLEARTWGTNPVQLVPANIYDGVLYIDTVTPPQYR
ncbi:erythromycin esterase family protein [Massilia sp. IC2-476]|uniref:erythromycin esterase family protein n=1 Tax=Massilia sp. IC2-476 TaxID=2887199 RepID=UPI001D116336|nr:erythromycin esterase family protein [Massilia sp. IC2-476]MCC2972139.1 erythromycin esterase family protein [Massilia sp. IC2-476]